MKTTDLIKKIQKLPFSERIFVIERSIRLIRKQEQDDRMTLASDTLYQDYLTDTELTAFKDIDFENFYETK